MQKRLDESLKKVSELTGRIERRDATIMRLRKRGMLQQQQIPSPIASPSLRHATVNPPPHTRPDALVAGNEAGATSWTPDPGSSTSAKSDKSLNASDEETEDAGLSDASFPPALFARALVEEGLAVDE